jgi:ABC-type transport system substrate-binding protein
VEYTPVTGYWDPEAVNVAKLVFLISGDDNARLNAVQTGVADVTFLRASMYQPAIDSGLVVCEAPSLSSYNLTLNTARSEFGRIEVRQAINHAINREAISAVTNGFCEAGVQLFPQFYFASNPDIGPGRYAYDPERARQLLAQAGLPNGFSFDLEVINLDLYQQIAEVIQQNLTEVGIQMSITPVEIAKLGEDFSVNKTADATLSEQKAESDPSILTASYYLADGFNNPGGHTTEEITRLHAEAMAAATAEERAPAYARLFEAVVEQAYPNVTLCHLTTPFAMNDTVRGVEIYADASRQFRGVGIEPRP